MLHEMKVTAVAIDPNTNSPILILGAKEGGFIVPIWIGLMEAAAIVAAIENITYERPMTHDLFKDFIEAARIHVSRIEVCDLKENTFYAKIYCQSEHHEFILDSRPSDAIALALRMKADIFVDDSVVQKLKIDEGEYEIEDKSEQGKKWAEYLKSLSPEDFGKYKV